MRKCNPRAKPMCPQNWHVKEEAKQTRKKSEIRYTHPRARKITHSQMTPVTENKCVSGFDTKAQSMTTENPAPNCFLISRKKLRTKWSYQSSTSAQPMTRRIMTNKIPLLGCSSPGINDSQKRRPAMCNIFDRKWSFGPRKVE